MNKSKCIDKKKAQKLADEGKTRLEICIAVGVSTDTMRRKEKQDPELKAIMNEVREKQKKTWARF